MIDTAPPPETASLAAEGPHQPAPLGDLETLAELAVTAPPEALDAAADEFAALGLSAQVLRAIADSGYVTPTPIQRQAIPFVLMGRDVLGCAQTGTGKTAGFTLPMLDILAGKRARARMPRSLILEPTRELALQVAESFGRYGKHLRLTHALIIGGESISDQRDLLMRGVDVLIATPGRLLDIIERAGVLLSDCGVLVIDEADRMLDMGFIPDVERIVGMLPASRQTLFFSATMAPEIRRLADAFLRNPKEVTVAPPASVATTITQVITLVAEHDKREALRRLIRSEEVANALIFCNRKRDVDILYKSLNSHGFSVGALHGDMAQPVRFATLERFKAGEVRLLCCSDVAARGLDIGGLSHVFNFDVPIHAEDYVHRIGRTGRAGREGRTFMLATPEDRLAVAAIEKLTGMPIPRLQIQGLDAVEWSEGDARHRGRRGKPAKAGAKGKAEARKPDKRPDAAPAKPEQKSVKAAKKSAAKPTSPAAVVAEADSTPKPQAAVRPPDRAPRDRELRDRDLRDRDLRDRDLRAGHRDADSAIIGFGAETPAFMLVAARRRPHAEHAADGTD